MKCTRIVKPGTTFSERSGGMRLVRLAGDPRKPPGRFELGDEARYMWVYEGDTSWNPLKLAGIVLLVIALCLFQLWPPAVRVGVWYLAVTVLLALFFTSVIQVLVLALAWLAGYELWVLPNLWSNTAMIWDLFSPVYTIEKSEGSAWYWRVGLLGVILGSGYWVASQPDELEKFMATNKQFVEDLYAGNLLSDGTGPSSGLSASSSGPAYTGPFGGSYGPGSNRYGGRQANIPRFDELEKMLQEEEELRAKDAAAQGKAQEQGEKEEHEGHDDVGKSADAEEDAPHDPEPEPDLDAMLAQDMEQEQAQEEGVQQGQEQEE